MSFLPPVVMEMRANASQFLTEQGKVIASVKATASETEKAAQKEAAAARTAAAEAKRAADQQVLASETAATGVTVATDRRIAAEARAAEAQAKATRMQADSLGVMTTEQQAAYDKQVAAAGRAANAVELAAAKEAQAQDKAAAAATAAAASQVRASELQATAAEKSALAQEAAATRTKTAMASVLGISNKITAVSLLAGAAVAVGTTEMASKFEKSTMLLVTAGGEQMSALDGVRKGILDISTQTGTSAEQMSEGMYIMEKAGFRGAAGLAALKAAAQGAKDENVSLSIMSQAVTDVLLDYGYKMDTAAAATDSSVRVTNMLVAASGAAKTTMEDFANSMSAVIPIASTAKISFAEVGGAIATMTQHGQTAQQSSQNLANLVMSLIRPNNLASAAMSQLGIDTTDLAKNLGSRGLSGTLKIVDDAIKAHTKDGMVFTGTMKDNANAAKAMDTVMGQMSPTMAKMSKGLQDGSVSIKDYTKASKDMGGDAGALGLQFMALYKANSGVTDALKAGKPAYETYNAALRDTLGNVTAMRAAQMLLMNDGREFQANIKAIGEAGKKTGSDISTWADMQETLSVQLDQSKAMVSNLGIEIGTKLIPVAKDGVKGFTDLFHGLEQGNPVLLGIAGIIGGALTISAINFGIQMGKTVVKTVSGLVEMGATAITQSTLFVKGMTADSVAVGEFSTKAELAGAKVKGMGGALAGAAAGATAVAAAAAVMAGNTVHATDDVDKITKALTDLSNAGGAVGKTELDSMFSNWDTMFGQSTSNVKGLDNALQLVLHPNGLQQAYGMFDGLAGAIGLSKTALGQDEDKVKEMGAALGKMAGQDITKAQLGFQHLALHTDGSKQSLQTLLDKMPAYKDALQAQVDATGKSVSSQELVEYAYGKLPQVMQDAAKATGGFTDAIGRVHPISPELQKSLDDAGVSADGLATDLGKVLDGMLATGMKTESARTATENFNKTLRDADTAVQDLVKGNVDISHALNSTATDFDLSTEAGATLNDKFTAVKDKGIEVAKSLAGSGKDAVSGALVDTYNNMLKAADSMGIHGQAAEDLTRNLLGIPKNVDVKTWVDTAAAQTATEKLHSSLDHLPTYKEIAVHVQYTDSGTAVLQRASDAGGGAGIQAVKANYRGGLIGAYAMGGLLGFDGGGVIPGTPPAAPNVDNLLAMVGGKPISVRSGEFITNEPATKMNLPWLKASNAGLNLGQAMRSSYAAGYANAPQQTGPAHPGGTAPHVTIHAQTNATAGQIANELSWVLRTQ